MEKINLLVYHPHPAHFEDRSLSRRGHLIFIMYMKKSHRVYEKTV